MAQKTIQWTLPMFKRFKAAHKAAVAAGESEFTFDDAEFDTRYAKYLIEHLETLFKARS